MKKVTYDELLDDLHDPTLYDKIKMFVVVDGFTYSVKQLLPETREVVFERGEHLEKMKASDIEGFYEEV